MSDSKDKLEKEIEELMEISDQKFIQGEVDLSFQLLEEAWNKIPGDKYSYGDSYSIVWRILINAITTHNFQKMNYWIKHFFFVAPERLDSGGERAFWAGKVAYENGNMQDAYEYFKIANVQSWGRCFVDEDKKYKIFFVEEEKNKNKN